VPPIPFSSWAPHPTKMDAATWARGLVAASPPPGGLVADPMCGSGTTIAAAVSRGLRAIGLESLEPFARAAQSKLTDLRDTDGLKQAARELVSDLRPSPIEDEHDFLKRCFPSDALAQLVALRKRVRDFDGPWKSHLSVALVAGLRDYASVRVGWPHAQPRLTRSPRATRPVDALVARVDRMADELDLHPSGWARLGQVERRDARTPFAWHGLTASRSIDAVITSPPYFTGFDYADAMRLELLFQAAESSNPLRQARQFQVAASAHHASSSKAIHAHRELGQWPKTQGACRVLSGALRHRRLMGQTRKPYDQVLPLYLLDLARILSRIAPLLRENAAVVVVVAHSAPAGIPVPVPRLLERLAEEMQIRSEGSEVLRKRGGRWPTSARMSGCDELDEELILLRLASRRSRRTGHERGREPGLPEPIRQADNTPLARRAAPV
jgi:hypothetical protein